MSFGYVCGVDPSGGGRDQFAWAIAHRDAERIIVDLVRGMGGGRQRLDLKAAVAACAEDCRRYGVGRVLGDRYGGDWPAAEFRSAGILYEPAGKDKAALYLEMLPLFTAGLIEIPDDRELVRQAKLLERVGAGRGRERVDHRRGGHDDLINSVALVVAALGPQVVAAGGIEVVRAGGAPSWAELEARYDRMEGGWEDSRGILEKVDDGYFEGRRFDW